MAHQWSGWENDILRALGSKFTIPPDAEPDAAYDFLVWWGEREGGAADWNPLNTNRPMPGSTPLSGNPDGVQNYPDKATGIAATVAAIRLYPTITAYLLAPWNLTIATDPRNGQIDAELRRWSGGGYGNPGGSGSSGAPGATPGHATDSSASDWTSFDLGAAWNALTAPLDVLKEVFRWFLWLLQPKHWVQMLEVVFGAILLGLGAWQLVKATQGGGAKSPSGVVKQATGSTVARKVTAL